MIPLVLFALLIAGLAVWSAVAAARAARAFPPEGEFVELGAPFAPARLHHVDRGAQRPGVAPIILIHGASGNLRDMTASLVPALEGQTRVIAVDRPGHGWSTRGPHPDISDPAMQARAIREAARQLGVERPVVLGHSWGAAVAAVARWQVSRDRTVLGTRCSRPVHSWLRMAMWLRWQSPSRVFVTRRHPGVNPIGGDYRSSVR